jgi:hypothetical protein
MKLRWLLCLALACGPAAGPTRAAGRAAARLWERSLVTLDVTRRQHDFFQPWSPRAQSVAKAGVVIGPREILTTAADLEHRTLVRVQKGGRGQWWNAEVRWVDYLANLALVSVADPAFWSGLKPVPLADKVAPDGDLQILRWRGGNLEVRKAEFNRFSVSNPNTGEAAHVVLELNSEIEGTGWAEPAVRGKKVIGLVFSQTGNLCQLLPAPYLRSILEAQRQDTYHGLGYFDFTWQPTENPETHRHLQLPGEPRGVVVIEVPPKTGTAPVVERLDILLAVDDFAIDTQGDYLDPLYGHLMLENLATRHKGAGDPVRLKVWRRGQALDVVYTLPRAQDAAKLVPESPPDQEPEYLIAGGLVFQPLTKNYLRGWGQDWERRAPFRLAYFRDEDPTPERPAIVILAQVLPDLYNLGYQDLRHLVVERVNGQPVHALAELHRALQTPQEGFHVFEFMPGEGLQRLVLDARTLEAATRRVLERYGIQQDHVFASPAALAP